jgi:hypothetical protein
MPEGDNGVCLPKTCRPIPSDLRYAVFFYLYSASKDGKVPHGYFSKAEKKFSVSLSTIQRIWKRGLVHLSTQSIDSLNLDDNRKNSGCRPKYNRDVLKEKILDIPGLNRQTFRDAAAGLNISVSLAHKLCKKEKIFKTVTLAVKPELTPLHKQRRLAFVEEQRLGDVYKLIITTRYT